MKRKRSGYAKKSSVNRQDQKKVQSAGNAEANGNVSNDTSCNGLCSIHWKPGTVAK